MSSSASSRSSWVTAASWRSRPCRQSGSSSATRSSSRQEHVAVGPVVAGRLHSDEERDGSPRCRRTRAARAGRRISVTSRRRRRSPGHDRARGRGRVACGAAERSSSSSRRQVLLEHLRPAVHHDDHAIIHARSTPRATAATATRVRDAGLPGASTDQSAADYPADGSEGQHPVRHLGGQRDHRRRPDDRRAREHPVDHPLQVGVGAGHHASHRSPAPVMVCASSTSGMVARWAPTASWPPGVLVLADLQGQERGHREPSASGDSSGPQPVTTPDAAACPAAPGPCRGPPRAGGRPRGRRSAARRRRARSTCGRGRPSALRLNKLHRSRRTVAQIDLIRRG